MLMADGKCGIFYRALTCDVEADDRIFFLAVLDRLPGMSGASE